jgi:ubiquinone/menaquinone biosynthesis C-methylase UbiE
MDDLGSAATHLGYATDIEIIEKLVQLDGRTIADVGCGDGRLARELAGRGAAVVGVEPDPIQATKNRNAEAYPGVTLVEGRAERLPQDTSSVDGVIFSKSLHHVPREGMDAGLREAARVLKPDDGFLYVVEPDMRGAFSQLVKPFHDETVVRGWALEALARVAGNIFTEVEEYWYTVNNTFDDFDGFVSRMSGTSYNAIERDDIKAANLRRAFEKGRCDGGYVFENPMRVRLYLKPVK